MSPVTEFGEGVTQVGAIVDTIGEEMSQPGKQPTCQRQRQPTSRTAGIESGPSTNAVAGLFSLGTAPRSLPVVYSDHSTRRTNRGRETMRDDPWTAANRDKEQQKATIPRRKPTAETPAAPTKPTISGAFWTGKKSAPDLPKPPGVVDVRQRADE